MDLTTAQIDAIRRTGQDVCVVAGPGSGKTTVLIERFAWLVEEQNVDPSRILAITFTEKAATEIKERLIKRFAKRFVASPELRESIERAWVSTIHGFCARLLRENSIAAELPPVFSVLDEASAEHMARESAEDALDAMFRERAPEMRKLLEALDLSTSDTLRKPDLARSLLDVYESMRVSGLRELPEAVESDDAWPRARQLATTILADVRAGGKDLPALREFANRLLALPPEVGPQHLELIQDIPFNLGSIGKGSRARAAADELKNETIPLLKQQWVAAMQQESAELIREAIARIAAVYRQKKRDDAAVDFAGLEEETIRLLEENPELRARTAARFDHILMDELQDTNRLQWKLINLIRRSFFAVGDINQSIYSFRYAEPLLFQEYRESLLAAGARIDELLENHRSIAQVLDAVSRVLDGQDGIENRALIASRGAGGTSGTAAVEVVVARGEETDNDDLEEMEARTIAARVQEFSAAGVDLKDIAILVRTLGAAQPFERALDEIGIPFVVSGGRTFLEAREIRDILCLLAALVNPLDDVALIGVLRSPLVGLSDEEIYRIGPAGWRERFAEHFGKFRQRAGFVAPDLLLATALDECGYASALTERARANIEKLFAYIRRQHAKKPQALAELLEDLESLRATQSEGEAPPPEAGNVVRIMTIHAAKGLEFPIVFVGAMHRRTDSSQPVIAFSPAAGLGVKWRNPVTGTGQSDRAHKRIVEELKAREAAEENRLLYVAMTRAEDRLVLSYVEKKRASGWTKLVAAAIAPTSVADPVSGPDVKGGAAAAAARDQLFDRPAGVSRHDGAATVTAIAQFHACPRKYLLSSIGTHSLTAAPQNLAPQNLAPQDVAPQNVALETSQESTSGMEFGAEFGTAVHRILAGEIVDHAEASTLAERFRASELGQRSLRATRLEREFDFLFYFEDVVLRGQIDLWFEEAGELIVVDYKTDREESPDAYALQLQIYALALERYAGRIADRAILYYLRPDKPIEIPINAETVRSVVRAYLEAADLLKYPMKPGIQCNRCSFYGKGCVGLGAAGRAGG